MGQTLYLIECLQTVEDSIHDRLRSNVVMATRIFKHRLQTFLHEVILNRNHPICAKNSYKAEFQGRVAAHYYGKLWPNFKKLEKKMEVNNVSQGKEFDYNLQNVDDNSLEKGKWNLLCKLASNYEDSLSKEDREKLNILHRII